MQNLKMQTNVFTFLVSVEGSECWESGCFDLFYHVSAVTASSSRCDPVPLI